MWGEGGATALKRRDSCSFNQFPVSRNYNGNGWMFEAEFVAELYNGCNKPHDFVTSKLLNRSSCNRSTVKQHMSADFSFSYLPYINENAVEK